MNKMYLAFYRSVHDHSRFMDRLISRATNSVYSHVELVYDMAIDYHCGRCISSSPRDGGVRYKHITFNRNRWDFVPIEIEQTEEELHKFMSIHGGKKYDWLGALGVVVPWVRGSEHRWFCSEIVAEFLGLHNPSSLSPGDLYSIYSTR